MPNPQSCHLEEGGENGEAEEEVEVSFEVGGVRRAWRMGWGTLTSVILIHSAYTHRAVL